LADSFQELPGAAARNFSRYHGGADFRQGERNFRRIEEMDAALERVPAVAGTGGAEASPAGRRSLAWKWQQVWPRRAGELQVRPSGWMWMQSGTKISSAIG